MYEAYETGLDILSLKAFRGGGGPADVVQHCVAWVARLHLFGRVLHLCLLLEDGSCVRHHVGCVMSTVPRPGHCETSYTLDKVEYLMGKPST